MSGGPAPGAVGRRVARKVERRTLLSAKRIAQALACRRTDAGEKQTVFVSGVQRSGTNMLMDVLERSFETEVFHESDSRAFDEYEMRPPEIIQRLIEASPARHVVIKALCELQEVRTLLDRFAPARVLWIVRDFRDVVNSHLALWKGMPESVHRIAADRESAGWRGRGMSDETHGIVRSLAEPDLGNASACALFWYFRNVLFFEQGLEADPRACLLRYERLVTHPHESFARAFDHLGIRYTPRVSRRVFASSVRRKAPPEIDPRIVRLCEDLTARFDGVEASTAP